MNLSYHWLKDYVHTQLSPQDLGEHFRMTSSELERIEEWGRRFTGLKVGKVSEVTTHPDANRLRIATVEVGEKKTRQIVCGAPNLAVGQTVIVALPGTTLTPVKGEPFTIQSAKIRGVESAGMLCAAEEIGIPLPSEGILSLDDSLRPGQDLAEALELNDSVLELEVTPNRPDLLSYVGLAREVATFDNKRLLEIPLATFEPEQASVRLSLAPFDPKHCQRYSAIALSGFITHTSPLWMQLRLLRNGIKPVSLVVDVTNYVMLELGQPLHAFDADTLNDQKKPIQLGVRMATSGEIISTLNGVMYSLEVGDLVISEANNLQPIALAGILGGQGSAITSTTERIVLEAAVFHGPAIRRTSRRLGVRTEASTRFEKGLDPEGTVTALKRAVYLLQELGGAVVCSTLADSYPKARQERPRIHLTFADVQEVLGVHISSAETKTILQKLGFHITSLTKSSVEVVPPSWRADIRLPEDVVEELIRIWGYERVPTTLPVGSVTPPQLNPRFEVSRKIRHTLASCGWHETIHSSFTSAQTLARVGIDPTDQAIALLQPLSRETEYLIPSHLGSLLTCVAQHNLNQTELALFELGAVFMPPQREERRLSILMRSEGSTEELYRTLKAVCAHTQEGLGLTPFTYMTDSEEQPFFTPGSSLGIQFGGEGIGYVGEVSAEVIQRFKLRSGRHLVYASLSLDALIRAKPHVPRYRPLSPYPSISRDLTLTIPVSTPAGEVERIVRSHLSQEIPAQVIVGAIYSGPSLRQGDKSVTFHLTYTHPERTLADAEVNADIERLTKAAANDLPA